MNQYITKVQWDDPYPKTMESRVEASSIFRAAYLMQKAWKDANPRKRLTKIKLEVIKI